jgi:hypothetical protein
VSDWTVRTLKEYFDSLREADREAVKTALDANERRFDSVNEFRQTLSDQAATFISRTEWQSSRDETERRLRKVEDAASGVAANRALLVVLFTLLIAGAGVLVALVA